MPPSVALCGSVLFIVWLFRTDAKERSEISAALWIPLTWLFVIGSRPVSLWLGDSDSESADGVIEDKLIDKALFLLLILAGLVVLSRRRVNWRSILQNNKWLFIYFLYLGISVLWSEQSFVSLKRWVKDVGNLVMVLVVLTEKDPAKAVRAFLARSAYLMIPLSVLVIKYYPELSRRYDVWTHQPGFVGISTSKNLLGMTLFVCGLSLFWMLLGLRDGRSGRNDRTTFGKYSVLLLMTAWLLYKAKSSTALSCSVVGGALVLAMRFPAVRSQVKHLGAYIVGVASLAVLLQASGVWDLLVTEFAEAVGRDPSLHGRAEIWEAVLKEDINPLIGTGFYSFWSEERNRRLSATYYYELGEAHNGYIETYLNSGLIGLALFTVMIAAACKGIKQDASVGSEFGPLRLAFLITIGAYGLSESIFDRLVHVWFILLLVLMELPRVTKPRRSNKMDGYPSAAQRALSSEASSAVSRA